MGESTQSTWGLHRARPTMNGLLVLSTLAAASAQVVLPYGGLAGYPYGYAGYPYAVAKPVVNEVEVPVPVVQYAAIDTGCTNHFGHAVPCFQEGEARRRGGRRGCPCSCLCPSRWTRIRRSRICRPWLPRTRIRWTRLPLCCCCPRPC